MSKPQPDEAAPQPPAVSLPLPVPLAPAQQHRERIGDFGEDELRARNDLVRALRRLSLAGGTSSVGADELLRATQLVDRLADDLGERRNARVSRFRFDAPALRARVGEPMHINQLNPAHPDLLVHFEGDFLAARASGDLTGLAARATVRVDALNEGPPDSVHGGVGAFLMDCMLGVLVQATGIAAVTGTLDLRYLARTPLEEEVLLRSRIVSTAGRKIRVVASMEHDGRTTLEASSLMVVVEPPPGSVLPD